MARQRRSPPFHEGPMRTSPAPHASPAPQGSGWARCLRSGLERVIDRIPLVEKEMLFVRRLVQPGWVCFDVGAAGGTYTHLLSRAVGAAGEVHAVEPRAASMRLLARLSRWLQWTNVTLHQVALTDRRGLGQLVVPRWVPTEAHLLPVEDLGSSVSDAELVETTTLDRLVRHHQLSRLDLITCDVEGSELQLLRGAERTLARFRPVLVCEIEQRHLERYATTPQRVLGWFERHGYRAYRVQGGRLVSVNGVTATDNDYVLWPEERPHPRPASPVDVF